MSDQFNGFNPAQNGPAVGHGLPNSIYGAPTSFDSNPDVETVAEADENPTRSKSKSRPRAAGKALDKATVRRVAAKALELEYTGQETLSVLAGILGTATDAVELTIAIMTADRSAAQPVKDIQATFAEAQEDQIGAVLGLNAASMTQVKAMWSTMAAVTGTDRPVPSNERKALHELFNMIVGLTTEQEELLNNAVELLRRG